MQQITDHVTESAAVMSCIQLVAVNPLIFILTHTLSASKTLQYNPVGNYFPSCLDIIDVYPFPYSILTPVGEHGGYIVYSVQVTFSKAITAGTKKELSTFILTPLLTTENFDISTKYVHSWHGSGRKYAIFFYVNQTLLNTSKVYFAVKNAMSRELVLNLPDRGVLNKGDRYCDDVHLSTVKCYSHGFRYNNTISVATIISEYYLSDRLLKLERPPPQAFQPNPYCNIQFKRPLFHVTSTVHNIGLDAMLNSTYIRGQAVLKINGSQRDIYLDIPITLKGRFQGRHAIQLPKFIKANVNKTKVTVKLSNYLGIQISQERINASNGYKLRIPVKIKDVYELKERTVESEYRHYGEIPKLMKEKYDKAVNASIVCPPKSLRNPSGHPSHFTHHIIEYGALYHLVVPQLSEEWQDSLFTEQYTQAFRANLSGNTREGGVDRYLELGIIAEELQVFQEQRSKISEKIESALHKYVCLLPSSSELSYHNASGRSWIALDKCIFVPYNIALSSECGGLQMFKSIDYFQNSTRFCDYDLGHCIGKPFSSTQRFPVIPTYGIHELTGWIPCSKCTDYSTDQEHPSKELLYTNSTVRAVARSLLTYQTQWKIEDGRLSKSVYGATIVLSPQVTTLAGYNDLKLRIKLDNDISLVYPELTMFEEASTLGCEYTLLRLQESWFSTSANLTGTILNSGMGGGDVYFQLLCSGLLQVYPLSGQIKQWIKPKRRLSVTYHLNSELAKSFETFVHHCNLTVRIPRYLLPDMQLSCVKSIPTYYGLFHRPCLKKADLVPLNLVYYVIPASDQRVKTFHQKMRLSMLDEKYTFLRGISVIPHNTVNKMQVNAGRLYSINIYCMNKHITVLGDDALTILNVPSKLRSHLKNNLLYDVKMATKRIYFLSKLDKPASADGIPTLCTLRLMVNQPNGYCPMKRVTVEEIFIPFSSVDIQAIRKQQEFTYKGHNMDFLRQIYGWQPFNIFFVMITCILTSTILCIFIAAGCICKHYFKAKLPRSVVLSYLKLVLKEAVDEDQKFWADPNSYLQLPTDKSPYGPHFILYNFTSPEPFDIEDLSSLRIAGVLNYRGKELQVLVGDINYIFIAKRAKASLWLNTASGMYLLKLENCSPDYRKEMSTFFLNNGVAT